MLLHISLLIILVLISSLITYNNVSEKREDKKIIVSNYEFPSNNMNDYKELKQILINRNLTERLFGSEKILSSNNTIIKNCSFIYSYIYLGLIGFILYLVFLIYTMKTVLQTYNKKFEAYILIMYSFMTSILLIPYTYLILSLVLTKNYNEKNTFNIQKVKVILTLCGIFIIGTTMLLYINYRTDYKTDKLIFYTSKQLKLEASKQYDLNLIESQKIEDLGIIENLYYYQLSNQNDILANIIYVTRDIDDITFKFFEIENKNNNLNINIKMSDEQLICLKDFESYNIEREYDNTVGIDKLKLPIGYYKDNSKNYIISRTFKYNKLITEYDNNNKSTVYELISQEDDLKNNKKVVNIEPNTNVDIYIVESNKKLLKDEESIDEYIKLTNNNSSWYTFYGNNYKIQYSIEPFTREGYGKNLGRLIEEDTYKLSKNNNSILFSALSKNAIFSLYNHTAINTENNIWLTNYTSTWLSKDYDIKAYYIDTRFNETIGYLLLNLYYDTNNNKFLTSFINYADFIVESWKTESYLVSDNRILPDYFSDNHTLKTHSSFNHQLALINYLFKAYELTENKDYYKTAKEILNGILGFKDSWIRENKDIWYEVNSKGEFSGTDYEIVTLDDMLYTQKYLYQFDKKLNEQLTKFIKSKLEYLKTKKVEIPSSTQELIDEYIKTE